MNGFRAFARVPFLYRPVVLQSGITANPRTFGDLPQKSGGVLFLQWLAAGDRSRPPFPTFHRRLHKFITNADRKILVLVHDAAISLPIIRPVITLFDQRPSFAFFLLLGVNELLD